MRFLCSKCRELLKDGDHIGANIIASVFDVVTTTALQTLTVLGLLYYFGVIR